MIYSAIQALRLAPSSVLIYALAGGAFHLLRLAVERFIVYGDVPAGARVENYPYEFAMLVAWAAALALIQSVAFARIGREMDKPLWKVPTDRESIARFFALWLLINLLIYWALQVVGLALQNATATTATILIIFWLLLASLAIPIGASVMFSGRVGREEIARGFDTLLAQSGGTLAVVAIAFAGNVVLLDVQDRLVAWAAPLVLIPVALLDCFLFACTWSLCMAQRERDENIDYSDLDF